jgi:hypothetical protein
MLGHQRQLDQRSHRPIGAQHRVGQLEQRIRPRRARPVELPPEPVQIIPRSRSVTRLGSPGIRHTGHRGHRFRLRALWKEPEEDQAVAASCLVDAPEDLHNQA